MYQHKLSTLTPYRKYDVYNITVYRESKSTNRNHIKVGPKWDKFSTVVLILHNAFYSL